MANSTGSEIRILHIVRNLEVGGMEGRVARLARGLSLDRFRIHIVGLKQASGRIVDLPSDVPYEVETIPPGLHWEALRRLSRRIRQGGYHIVHTHNWPTMLYGIVAARLARTPVVFHGEHGLESAQNIPWKRRVAQSLLARMATHVVAVNNSIGKAVQVGWKLPQSRISVLNNGVDLIRFHPSPEPPSIFTIGTVGRHVPVKDLPCLLRAFALLRQALSPQPCRLILVGDGPLSPALREMARDLDVTQDVEFAGDSRTPEAFYPRFSVYANTSVYEGMSNTLLEAMASGLPLVASDVAGNRDWLREGENALFFPSGNAEALSQVFLRLAKEPPLLSDMATKNRQRAEDDFDNQGFLKKYAALYEAALHDAGVSQSA